MQNTKEKSALIAAYEENFAEALARHVIDKPNLSIWMILIPIFFVFYFFQLNRYRDGRRMFAEHYLVSKKRALHEAVEVVDTGRKPDCHSLAKLSDMPDSVKEKQADVLAVLVEHYTVLLKAHGEDYPSLVRKAYGSLTNYLLMFNRLKQTEKEVNKALAPHLEKSHKEISDVISKMESYSEQLWRDAAESIFK